MPAHNRAIRPQEFRRMVEKLKRVAPPPHGSRVRVKRVADIDSGNWADCDFDEQTYTIRILANLTKLETEFLLLHEWAHVLSPWEPHQLCPGDHDDIWGAWYARVYRAYWEVE